MNHKFHFADTEDLVNLCNVLGRTFARRHSWINTMTEREGEKIDSRLDDMEKVSKTFRKNFTSRLKFRQKSFL